MKTRILICLLLWLVGLAPFATAQAEPIAIIVHKGSLIESLSWGELKRIYQGQQTMWADGQKIQVANLPVHSPIRKQFYNSVLGVEPTTQFYQRGSPIPFKTRRLKSDRALRIFVSVVPGAVGYIRLRLVDGSVKVLQVNGRSPTDRDYKLQ